MNLNNLILMALIMCIVSSTAEAQDWANLKRYQKENAALFQADSIENRIVFMGNSITEGWGRLRPEFFADRNYINRGIGGQTSPQMLLRFRQDVINLKPAAVVILAGVNDIAGNTGPSTLDMIFDNIKSMADLATANDIQVILCSVLPAYDFPWRKGLHPAEKVVRLNELLKHYASENGFVYVDYFSAMANSLNGLREDLGADGIHPNSKGYALMEPLIEKAIDRALIE